MTLLAGLFVQRDKIAVIALLLLAVAGVGFAGLDRHGLIQVYVRSVGVLTAIIGIMLLVWPGAVTRRV